MNGHKISFVYHVYGWVGGLMMIKTYMVVGALTHWGRSSDKYASMN